MMKQAKLNFDRCYFPLSFDWVLIDSFRFYYLMEGWGWTDKKNVRGPGGDRVDISTVVKTLIQRPVFPIRNGSSGSIPVTH